MPSVSYVIRASFTNTSIAEDWLLWLQTGHVAEVLASGASSAELIALDAPQSTYEVRYRFPSREALDAYERDHAPRLRADGLKLFPTDRGITYHRYVGDV